MSSGANIEARDVDNYTPLLTAAEFGQTEVFRLLLELKPRPASLTVHNMTKKSALFLAAESNHPEIIKVHKNHLSGYNYNNSYLIIGLSCGLGSPLPTCSYKGNIVLSYPCLCKAPV